MELTLRLPPADAARLARLPIVKSARTARARGQPDKIVWHDGPDGELAARGLALAEHRGSWRMTRHFPAPEELWPPGRPPVEVEEADRPDALAVIATFEGRRTIFALAIDGQPVAMTLLAGGSRAGPIERPVARLLLSGSAPAVRVLLASLVEDLTLDVPAESLAMEAVSLALGHPPRPRRAGAPVLASEGLSAEAAFAHILGHLTDVLIAIAPAAASDGANPEPVHQMRVAVRRARSALALFAAIVSDPLLPRAADGLRALGQVLGPARDWDVFATETLPPVMAALPTQSGLAGLHRAAARERETAHTALNAWLEGPAHRRLMLDLACLAAAEPPAEGSTDLTGAAAGILGALWKKTMRAGRTLEELDNPALHRLRLKAKRLRYAAEFFAPLFPRKPTSRFIRRLAALQERLGVFNDNAVAESLQTKFGRGHARAAGLVLGFTAAKSAGIRPKIASAWARFQKRGPFWT